MKQNDNHRIELVSLKVVNIASITEVKDHNLMLTEIFA